LLDGPVALVAHLLAFGGSSAPSLEAQQAGLWAAGIATAVSGKSGPLMELSPAGGLREVKRLNWLGLLTAGNRSPALVSGMLGELTHAI
jgi:hypothetical protein